MTTTVLIDSAALALLCIGAVCRLSKTGRGALAIGFTLLTIVCAATNQWPLTTGSLAGNAAIWAWSWWHHGGDDDTRRRLREAMRPFRAVRRTAPVTT
ncbi:hypothetical protein OG234_13505 [Streptomyces sp. NBC_01420]|uniref:hypothetical protein n=1 Tax=Streptomyces sp. NBC_01420 TaxID=2903858 RepID=UPI0032534BFD